MNKLTHTEALQIVVQAARVYVEIVAHRESKAHKPDTAEVWQAIETLQTPPLFQPTFKRNEW